MNKLKIKPLIQVSLISIIGFALSANAEQIKLSSGTIDSGRISGFSENGVQFHSDRYYVYDLDKIVSASVDEDATGAEAERQKKAINRLNRLIDREHYKKQDFDKAIRKLLSLEAYDKLEETAERLRTNKKRWQSGDWLIERFYYGLYSDLSTRDVSGYLKRLAKIEDWVNLMPESSTAKVAQMSTLKALAWAYRGNGYSDTVSSNNMQRFRDATQKILDIASDLIAAKSDTPMMYSYLVSALNWRGADTALIQKVALKALEIEPSFIRPVKSAFYAMLPQWGGSYAKPVELLDKAYELFPVPADEYYYLAVVAFMEAVKDREYASYGFDWRKIRAGFESYRQDSFILDRDLHLIAKLAALHGDSESAKQYFDLTDGEWNHFAIEVWQKPAVLKSFQSWANQKPNPVFAQILQAAFVGKVARVRNLVYKYIDAKSELDRKDVYGNTLLHIAINFRNQELVEKLIKAGARIDLPNGQGHLPIHLAAGIQSTDLMTALIEAGADVTAVTSVSGRSALHFAAGNGRLEAANLLMDISPELLVLSDKRGRTPLHLAASLGHENLIAGFLEKPNVPLAAIDQDGDTALFKAIEQQHLGIVRLFFDSGVDMNQKNKRRHTPLSYAKELRYSEIVDYLAKAGAPDASNAIADQDLLRAKELIAKATVYSKREDAAKAIKLMEAAIELNPEDFGAYHTLAVIQWQMARDPQSAAQSMQKSLELNPHYAESYYVGGRIFYDLKKPEVYKPWFQKYVAMSPNTYNAKDLKRNYPQLLKPDAVKEEEGGVMSAIQRLVSDFF